MSKENKIKAPDTFDTRDIKLASYLLARGGHLISVETSNYSHHDSSFILDSPPEHILQDWMNGAPCDGKRILYEYRKLLAISRRQYDNAKAGVW